MDGGVRLKTLKVVEVKKENGIHQLSVDEAEKKVVEAMGQGCMVVANGEFIKGRSELRRILESVEEVFIVPPFAGG